LTESTKKANDTTLLVLLVDRSGSMESIRTDMEGGIKTLLKEQSAEAGTCLVTIAQFDTEYDLLFNAVPVDELGDYRLVPRGATALLDAIGKTIGDVKERLASLPAKKQPDVVFAVVTDGLENSSMEWTRDQVLSAVKDRVDAGWAFTFLGADQDAIQEGERLGLEAAGSLTYGKSRTGAAGAMRSLSRSMSRKRLGLTDKIEYTDEERRDSAD
jgi:uncharacterized protein YegL